MGQQSGKNNTAWESSIKSVHNFEMRKITQKVYGFFLFSFSLSLSLYLFIYLFIVLGLRFLNHSTGYTTPLASDSS